LSKSTKNTFLGVGIYLQGTYKQLDVVIGKVWIKKSIESNGNNA